METLISLLKLIAFVYLAFIPIAAVYFLSKVFLGNIPNPDEDDVAWMNDLKAHPVREFFKIIGLSFVWILYPIYLQRKYNKEHREKF